MRRWGVLITAFYIAVVAALSPAFWWVAAAERWWDIPWSDFARWEFHEWYWGWVALLAGGPLVLLSVAVDTSRKRLNPRRPIIVAAAAAAIALALLLVAAVASVLIVILVLGNVSFAGFIPTMLATWLGSWLLWTLVLWRLGERILDPVGRLYRWLIAGSVLELLIAVPSHVIIRQRSDCSAPAVTAFGVATGIAILLMSLGPGALFLYRARIRRISAPADSASNGR